MKEEAEIWVSFFVDEIKSVKPNLFWVKCWRKSPVYSILMMIIFFVAL
jgi:hypothetical protein